MRGFSRRLTRHLVTLVPRTRWQSPGEVPGTQKRAVRSRRMIHSQRLKAAGCAETSRPDVGSRFSHLSRSSEDFLNGRNVPFEKADRRATNSYNHTFSGNAHSLQRGRCYPDSFLRTRVRQRNAGTRPRIKSAVTPQGGPSWGAYGGAAQNKIRRDTRS